MLKIGTIIAAVLVYLGFQSKAKADAGPMTYSKATFEGLKEVSLDDLYKKYGQQHGLDWKLLKAIAQVESSEDSNAKNPNDPSYGLMQILCQPDGSGGCRNNLNVLDWPPADVSELYDPEYSLHIGAQILSWNIGRYGLWRGVACYNHWGARHAEPNGPFPNQGYVDKVKAKFYALGGVYGA